MGAAGDTLESLEKQTLQIAGGLGLSRGEATTLVHGLPISFH